MEQRPQKKSYQSLEQRIAAGYGAMLPPFFPKEGGEVRVEEQREFYDLMKALYQLLFDDPALLSPSLHEDDAFPTRYKKGYGKPRLQADVLKMERAVKDLLKAMYLLGQGQEVKLSRRTRNLLSLLGVTDPSRLPAAWTWMARRPGAGPVALAYCLFDPEHVYSTDVYARLLGEAPFRRLESWLRSHGYRPYDQYQTEWVDFRLSLTYGNPVWSPERPGRGYEYKIRHTGIAAQYDAYAASPVSVGLCIPYGLRPFLERFSQMSPKVQAFVLKHTKRCDGCGYCVQTDKTGLRPKAWIPIAHEGASYRLCPHFPGYTYSWAGLDDALVDDMTEFLAFMDGFAKEITQTK